MIRATVAAVVEERNRYREALERIAETATRNQWHPDTTFPESGRNWHDGYITCAASHFLLAQEALDPETAAATDEMVRASSEATDEEWWQRTGHCGGCGDVGSSCGCDGRCGCAKLHGPRLPDWKSPNQRAEEAEARLAAIDEVTRDGSDPTSLTIRELLFPGGEQLTLEGAS